MYAGHLRAHKFGFYLSAYEVKTNLSLFERPFKVKKNGVFFFVMSSPALEIFKSKDTNDDAINGYSVVRNDNSRLYLKIARHCN